MDRKVSALPPRVSWTAGWRFGASAWSGVLSPGPRLAARSLAAPGDLALLETESGSCSLHLGVPPEWGTPEVRMLANAFWMRFPDAPGHAEISCGFTRNRVIVGASDMRIAPALFSPQQETQGCAGRQSLQVGNQNVALHSETTASGCRYALAVTETGADDAFRIAAASLDTDLAAFLASEYDLRRPVWQTHAHLGGRASLLNYAVEALVSRLRPSSDAPSAVWCAGARYAGERMNANSLFPLVAAWCLIDASVAKGLVRGVLACRRPDGSIPAALPLPPPGAEEDALPMIAQAARLAWRRAPDPHFLTEVLPLLEAYIRHLLERVPSPPDPGICWRTADEALIPDTFDSGLVSADLVTLMICEIDAFEELARQTGRACDDHGMHAARQRLADVLDGFLWDESAGLHRSRYATGKRIERRTLAAVLPLLWEGLPSRQRSLLLRHLSRGGLFHRRNGAPLWAPWPGDPSPPPMTGVHQVLLLEALHRSGAAREERDLADRNLRALLEDFRRAQSLPRELGAMVIGDSLDSSAPAHTPGDESSEALAILASGAGLQRGSLGVALGSAVEVVDAHRAWFMGILLAMTAVVLIGITLLFMQKKSLTRTSFEVLAGLGHQHYLEGRYDQAAVIYKSMAEGAQGLAAVDFVLANTLFKNGDYAVAEAHYRRLLSGNFDRPHLAMMNLGLTLFRQGRLSEAEACYREFMEKYGNRFPYLSVRAETALELIAEHTARREKKKEK